MVGFGSSLRIARRPGWEGAYLDYETLKLLLSQIEAIYEEEGHRRGRSATVFDQEAGKPKDVALRDYRDELFLESDSDKAYISVDDSNEEGLSSNSSGEDNTHLQGHHQHHHHVPHHNNPHAQSNQPFRLSYSKEASSSDEEGKASGCGAGVTYSFSSWTSWDKSSSNLPDGTEKKPKKRKNNMSTSALGEEDAFYMPASGKNIRGHHTFFMTGATTSIDEESQPRSNLKPSFLNAPVMSARETTSLLPPTTPGQTAGSSSLYTFSTGGSGSNGDSLTPPIPMYVRSTLPDNTSSVVAINNSNNVGNESSAGGVPSGDTNSPPVLPPHVSQRQQQTTQRRYMEERLRERKQRRMRRRRLKAIRRERERKIPRHLRLAHSKARAITERFLGLLRAETEKVMLFAQSRLGELADTAGSLRFSNMDDFDNNSVNQKEARAGPSFDYPLLDGGLHPSASSSEDEGVAAGQGTWTDSSEDDDKSHSQPSSVPNVFSVGGVSDGPSGERRKTREKHTPQKTTRKKNSPRSEDQNSNQSRVQEYANAAVRRQIAHFTELRKRRPVFLRNDQILGEDMLLISAVEEVDGYTAVSVELLHVLRYICVNLIAVRKICLKHDRLLMNRMLGGYYQRYARNLHGRRAQYTHIEDAQTLGAVIAVSGGDIYEAHPSTISNMSQFKLVGLYDRKIQKLANSRTVQVVSSCLALALSEYEVARSRADALTKLNSGAETPKRSGGYDNSTQRNRGKDGILEAVNSDDEGYDGPPSTTSSISLTRLRFSVTSIFALREAARYKTHHFNTYLSRSMLTFTGRPIIGEGLDGCSRATLDFFVAFNPDAALLLATDVLHDGLNRGRWMQESMADLMISALAVAASTAAAGPSPALLFNDLTHVTSSINVDPESRILDIKRFNPKVGSVERMNYYHPELPQIGIALNAMGCFLFQMNYYVAHATTNTFVASSGASYAYSSLIIGAPNLSALIVAVVHGFLVSGDQASHSSNRATVDVGLVRTHLILSGLAGLFGNIVHGVALDKESLWMAVLGRFLIGFSSAEILHRQLVQATIPSQVVSATAKVVLYRVSGTVAGLCLGILAELLPLKINSIGVRSIQSTSWVMMLLWIIYIVRLLVQFRPKAPLLLLGKSSQNTAEKSEVLEDMDGDFGNESSDSDHIGTPRSFWSASRLSTENFLSYGGGEKVANNGDLWNSESAPLKLSASKELRKRGSRVTRTFGQRLRKLLSYHVAIPTLLFIVFYVNFASEMFFTATPLVTHHYFNWGGPRAGALLVLLTSLILPVNFFCETVARRYEERTILKRTIVVVTMGAFILINWTSMFSLAKRVPSLFTEMAGNEHTHTYDWNVGILQYTIGTVVSFIGLVAVESATLSLLSKLAPLRLRSVVLNLGTLVVVMGFVARIVADLQLTSVVLSHRVISTDVINTIAIPLFLFSLPMIHLIRKHFFYLM
eukprot:CAMPEP_0172466868 /NCGR_PEP_ID=MMETSP1065-20121228/57300_1 /TAXON_ID=265537 /ORGANISM="Amphiprora paludosa, Strain CCMP125" /LENGTH=1447 /DNA_ID=CAMNT_0013223813 /DNA_START=92 /DNA_END=4435 /DNA_ORIENTATION=-